jgi:hypothetical protein
LSSWTTISRPQWSDPRSRLLGATTLDLDIPLEANALLNFDRVIRSLFPVSPPGMCGGDEHTSAGEAVLIHAAHMFDLQPDLQEVADLPEGFYGWRNSANEPWKRYKTLALARTQGM